MVGGVYGWFEYAGIYGVTFRNRFLSLSLFLWFCLLFEGKRGINNCGYRYSSIFITRRPIQGIEKCAFHCKLVLTIIKFPL